MVLPEGVDPASISADYKDGVLLLHVPKALEAAKPKTTKIALGESKPALTEEPPAEAERPSAE